MATASIFGPHEPQLRINYEAHPGQEEISLALAANFASETPASIVEIICSRGWGKTLYMVCEILIPFLMKNPMAKVMWVAPTYQIGMSPIDDVFNGVNEVNGARYVPEYDDNGHRLWEFVTTKSGPVLKWFNGATVIFRSADSPDSIVSKGFNRIIIDEAALIEQQVFEQQILGTARKAGIKIFLISTPRGKKHWTYKIFMKGQAKSETQYISFQQSYLKNPYFSETLAKLIKDIPEWIFRQEYMAEFIEDGESVIRGLEHVLFGSEVDFPSNQQEWEIPLVDIKGADEEVQRKISERKFVVGLDIAKSVDYSVLWVMDVEYGDCVYYRRLNKMDYRDLLKATADLCHKYNEAELIFDATGVGAGLADMLNSFDIISHPYVFTNESKNEIINKLILAIEYQEIKIPNITTVKGELSVFTYTMTRTGKISYAAPSGYHDDIVMSLALANWYRKENSGLDNLGVVDEIVEWNDAKQYQGRPGSMIQEMEDDND